MKTGAWAILLGALASLTVVLTPADGTLATVLAWALLACLALLTTTRRRRRLALPLGIATVFAVVLVVRDWLIPLLPF